MDFKFHVGVSCGKAFVMNDDGDVSEVEECFLKWNNFNFSFIKQGNLYAYSEFFTEGTWPEEFYDEGERVDEYDGLRLKMVDGCWYSSVAELFRVIRVINSKDEDLEFWKNRENRMDFHKKVEQALSIVKKCISPSRDRVYVNIIQQKVVAHSRYLGRTQLDISNLSSKELDLELRKWTYEGDDDEKGENDEKEEDDECEKGEKECEQDEYEDEADDDEYEDEADEYEDEEDDEYEDEDDEEEDEYEDEEDDEYEDEEDDNNEDEEDDNNEEEEGEYDEDDNNEEEEGEYDEDDNNEEEV